MRCAVHPSSQNSRAVLTDATLITQRATLQCATLQRCNMPRRNMPYCYTASTTPSSICDVRPCGRNGAFRVGNEEPYPLDIEFMRKVTAPRLVATKTPNVEPLTPNVEPCPYMLNFEP